MSNLVIKEGQFIVEYVPVIRLYERHDDGRLMDIREEYHLPELGGVIPLPGDLIVAPGVVSGLDRLVAENRTVYEVVQRYFKPAYPKFPLEKSETMYAWVVLEVKPRPGMDDEEDALAGGYG